MSRKLPLCHTTVTFARRCRPAMARWSANSARTSLPRVPRMMTMDAVTTGPLTSRWGFAMFAGGEVTERPKVPDSKSGVVRATAGSNPALSAVSGWNHSL